MCLIFFALNQHPSYKLIIAANRDEFYQRPTQRASWWQENKTILGGKDSEAGGTWMGITKQGKIAFVTNYRDLPNLKTNAPSRGELVSDYLTNHKTAHQFLESRKDTFQAYNGFNLVVGNVNQLWYCSNYKTDNEKLDKGIFGLSNALLDTPWPKVNSGKEEFKKAIEAKSPDVNNLFGLLQNETQASDNHLPNTGLGIERERVLSARFIKSPGYGTRCSTVILINNNNEVHFVERTYNLQTFYYEEVSYDFEIKELPA
jgi:uncharacterized protein with NRDE domain